MSCLIQSFKNQQNNESNSTDLQYMESKQLLKSIHQYFAQLSCLLCQNKCEINRRRTE